MKGHVPRIVVCEAQTCMGDAKQWWLASLVEDTDIKGQPAAIFNLSIITSANQLINRASRTHTHLFKRSKAI